MKLATIVLLVVLAGAFFFNRGLQNITKQMGLDCQYHFAYTVCTTKDKKSAQLPGIMDIIKAGFK